jgi:hypothetical protein
MDHEWVRGGAEETDDAGESLFLAMYLARLMNSASS